MQSYKLTSDGHLIVTAPAMIPNARDCDYKNGEPPLTKEQIREFAKSYEKYQFIDHEHGLTRNGERIGTPIDSFLLTEDTNMTLADGSIKSYPAGSWFITSELTDKSAINTAINGGYTGYSVSVFSRNRADQYLEALKHDSSTPIPPACKSSISSGGTGLIKDVVDPVVLSVSLVKSPCLHDSKFCELKQTDGEIMTEDVKSMKSKILSAMGMSEEAEVESLKSEVVELKSTIEELKVDFAEALKSMQEEFKVTLESALKPVEVEAEKSEEATDETVEAEKTETEEPVEEEVEAEKAEEEEEEENPEEEEEEKVAEKGESKAEPIHDNIEATKSKPQNIYEALGRNPDGTRRK